MHNKVELAKECQRFGLLDDAIILYHGSLTGIYKHDPDIMLGLAQTYFQQEDYAACKKTLADLIEQNPEFKSADGHMLYARTLEALGEDSAALEEYKVLSDYYAGYEAKCRYGLLLRKIGQSERADTTFNDILTRAQQLPNDRRKIQKEWIQIAKQQMG